MGLACRLWYRMITSETAILQETLHILMTFFI